MTKKNVVLSSNKKDGIQNIVLAKGDINYTVSLSDEGCKYLDNVGADIVLDFDKDGKLLNIQMMGFN